MSNQLNDRVARDWLAARDIIAAFLREIMPGMTQAVYDHNAGAILARLAHHEPPLLITAADEDNP